MTLSPTKTLKSTKKTSVTKTDFQCDFCGRYFQRETSQLSHACEHKRRWQDKDLPGNRIGFQSWLEFYKRNTTSKKQKTYLDFSKSAYYIAFVKFGNYCVDIKCIGVSRYASWLLQNQIKIDSWCSDTNYDKFLIEHVKNEDPFDAIARSIETTIDLAKEAEVQSNDCLRYVNTNRVLRCIINGKISPWMLFQSESGIEFIERLDEGQQKMILDYINPEQWALKFRRNSDMVNQISSLLKQAGY